MITPNLEDKSSFRPLPTSQDDSSPLGPSSPLPRFSRFIPVVAIVNAPLVAWFLLAGKLWSVGSVFAGVAISLAACGLLHLFVARIMPFLIAGLSGRGRNLDQGTLMQFIALVGVKFLAIGLLGYLILNFREVNLPAVLIGFAMTQTAIVAIVARHYRTR